MRVLFLYGALAIALLVCCLAPGEALGKPAQKKRDGPLGRVGKNGGGEGETTEPPREDDESGGNDERETGSGEAAGDRRQGRPADPSPVRPRYIPGQAKRRFKGPNGFEENAERMERNKMKKAMRYMSKYGYMGAVDEDDWDTDSVSEKKMRRGIKMMQTFMGLNDTGELDAMTMMMMDKPRCGLRDVPLSSPGSAAPNGTGTDPLSYTHFGQRWETQEISYRFLNYPSTMPTSEAREAVIRGFRVWSDVTPLRFHEVGRTVPEFADFYIKFGARSHGDAFPFDGRGGVLAHAFLPGTGAGDIEGDIHFDDEELFTYASYTGTNLFQVAAHEIGHSLGLSHSTDPTALMAPFYPGWQPTFYMPYDDIAGIQSLYGSNPNPRPYPNPYPNPDVSQPTTTPASATQPSVSPTTTQAPTSAPNPDGPTQSPSDPCSPLIDATTVWRGEFFAFTGNKYGRIRDYQILSQVGGSTASYFFQNFPRDIDALYESPATYRLLMFKGPSFYVYDGLMQESGPLPITHLDPSLPSDIDAVVSWAVTGKTYFFKDDLVWQFDEGNQSVDSGWPYPIGQVWAGLPNGVTAAWHDDEQFLTYFMVGSDYYRYDDLYAELDLSAFPRDFIADYFGCF